MNEMISNPFQLPFLNKPNKNIQPKMNSSRKTRKIVLANTLS